MEAVKTPQTARTSGKTVGVLILTAALGGRQGGHLEVMT
jgi:hypothetical protein